MNRFLKRILGERLKIDWKIAVVTIVSTLLIMVDYYYSPTSKNYFDSILLYVAMPLLITILDISRKSKIIGIHFWRLENRVVINFPGAAFYGADHLVPGCKKSGHDELLCQLSGRIDLEKSAGDLWLGISVPGMDLIQLCQKIWL